MLIILIGPFPNPITGMSYINNSFYKKLKQKRKKIIKINTTLRREETKFFFISRIFLMILNFYNLICHIKYKKTVVYLSLSASYGIIFDLIFILITKSFKCKSIIHHHSSKYIIRYSFAVKLVCFLIKKSGLHICLSKKMKDNLNKKYQIDNSISLSNIFFLNKSKEKKSPKKKLVTIGFLGNIIEDKGIFTFLRIFKNLSKFDIKGIVGGPIHENKSFIKKKFHQTKNLKYLGKIDNLRKENFFKNIDIFLFPSKLTEAEPLVILECLKRGVPVIATDKGYIKEILVKNCGFVFKEDVFLKRTTDILIQFIQSNLNLNNFSLNCFLQSKKINKLNIKKFNYLLDYIDGK